MMKNMTIVMIPPEPCPNVSDEEEVEEDGGEGKLPLDVSGTLELRQSSKLRERVPEEEDKSDHDTEEIIEAAPSTSIRRGRSRGRGRNLTTRGARSMSSGISVRAGGRSNWPEREWHDDDIALVEMEAGEVIPQLYLQYPLLKNKSALEIYKLFFDEEIEMIFIKNTEKYAKETKNIQDMKLTKEDLWKFFTIITMSCYNERPQYRMYWSKEEDIGCPLVPQLMSRNKFELIKSCIHVCDNNELNEMMMNNSNENVDKWFKLRPLLNACNDKFRQFGINNRFLSIDEQIIPYYGHHGCKMYHREKPLRFGFQNWVMAGDDGAPYNVDPYQGKAGKTYDEPIGTRVVKENVQHIENPTEHVVFFDNLFTSLPLMENLREREIKATGTLRANRLQNCNLPSVKEMEKETRGTFKTQSTDVLCVTRYTDNRPVTMVSNYQGKIRDYY
jgi:hypothetical protein